MLACQMKRLTRLVKKFSDFQGQRVHFWIDSICVPVEDRTTRSEAIGSMFSIYAKARATIVLSADLMDAQAGQTQYLEPAMRIATSKWMRRLWTFQEGVMSRNLYFLFADVSVVDLLSACKSIRLCWWYLYLWAAFNASKCSEHEPS